MSEKEKLESLKNKVIEEKDKLYNGTEEDVFENFYNVKSLSDAYEAITGDEVFNLPDFIDNTGDLVSYLIDQINTRKNDLVLKEKEEVKKSLFLNSGVLSDTSILVNDYYEDLKSNIKIPKGNFKKYFIDNLITKVPNRKLDNEEIKNIVNAFLEEVHPKHKDLYDQMNEEGRIFLLDDKFKRIIDNSDGFTTGEFNYDNSNHHIVVKKYDNDLEKVCTLTREITKIIELENLRDNLNKEEFLNYTHVSQYRRIISSSYALKCYDFLEKIGYPNDEIKKFRTKELLRQKDYVDKMLNNIYGKTEYLENYNHDLEYALSAIGSNYISNLDNDKFNKTMKIFNSEKTKTNGLEIFDKIGCSNKEIKDGLEKQIKKCI